MRRRNRAWPYGGLLTAVALWLALAVSLIAADKLPAPPEHYFNDYAGVVSARTASALDDRLRNFERETSNQIVVAVYRSLPADAALEDYTQRTAESWRVGQKLHNNGVVLFVFTESRKMRIEVGYGLEGALPDITAKEIIDNEIRPAFRAGNFDAGLSAGVEAIMKATRGEYKGTGRTAGSRRDQQHGEGEGSVACIVAAIVLFFLLGRLFSGVRRGTVYSSRGRRRYGGGPWIFPMGGGWGGGGGGGWGGGGGGGGGFSGGGGSFGGGGASGDW